jgi:DNA/RNA endonuclease YhcR with UshA esterase domain
MKINDRAMFNMALFVALVGITGMVVFAGDISPRELKVDQIEPGMIDQEVSVEGVVEKVDKSDSGNTYFLQLNDGTGKITIVLFENTANEIENSGLKIVQLDKSKIKVTGKVSEFKGALEIVLDDPTSLKLF